MITIAETTNLMLIIRAMFDEIDEIYSKSDGDWSAGKYHREDIAKILWPDDFSGEAPPK